MSILVGILSVIPLFIAIAAAYYFGIFVEESLGIHSKVAIAALTIGFGALVWWLLVQYVLPAVGVMLGLDMIPYQL